MLCSKRVSVGDLRITQVENLHSLENHKQWLIVDQFTRVSITQLVNAINTSNQDQNNWQGQKGDEDFEVGRDPVVRGRLDQTD